MPLFCCNNLCCATHFVRFVSSKKKPININILDRTVSGTNRNRPWNKRDPSLGQVGTCPLHKPNSTVKSRLCPVCPWDRWGFVSGTIVPQGPLEECVCAFCFLVFLRPSVAGGSTSNLGNCLSSNGIYNCGAQSETPRQSWKPDHQQHPDTLESQDSELKLNQPRGSSPELTLEFESVNRQSLTLCTSVFRRGLVRGAN